MEQHHVKELPYVFILDWDGTIAGRVDFQSQQFTLYNHLKKHGFKVQRTNPIPPAFYPKAKLIRPGFASFIKNMRDFLSPSEVYFFVYTGSEKTWAHQEIAWMEKTHGVSLARPIFVRDDCTVDAGGNTRKNIAKVFPRIMRTISKSSGRTLSSADRIEILEKRTMIIDNNAVYSDRSDKLLLCPDYNYAVFENLLHGIPAEARNHPDIQKVIFSFVNQGVLCPLPNEIDDGMHALTKQYSWLAAKCKALTEQNQVYKHDDFWTYLSKLIAKNNIRVFSAKMIKKMQDATWKHFRASAK